MRRGPEGRLHDYLDGRLSAEEREAVERLLAEDPALARRVEDWRELGRALREGQQELSPDFHARLRRRFERSAPEKAPRGWRILSWEAAGLAAAVVLAGVLFAPDVLRRREPQPPAAPADDRVSARSAGATEPASPSPESRGQLEETLARDHAPPAPDPPRTAEESKKVADRRDPERDSPVSAPAPRRDAAEPAEPGPSSAVEKESKPLSPAAGPSGGREREPAEQRAASAEAAADTLASLRTSAPAGVEAVELPPGVPDGVQVVEDRAIWEGWLAGPAGPQIEPLGGYDADQRLVLVGMPGGADCAGLSLQAENGSYRVRIGRGAAAGCAFLVPRDGRGVRLEVRTKD